MVKDSKLSQEQERQRDSLSLKYPLLKKYIHQCYENGEVDSLMDFLDGLVLDESPEQ